MAERAGQQRAHLTTAFSAVAARLGQVLTVTDVVPPLPGDSPALSPFFVILSVLLPSMAAGSASALVFRRSRVGWCVAAPVVAAVGIGLVTAAIADGVAGLGNYPAIAGTRRRRHPRPPGSRAGRRLWYATKAARRLAVDALKSALGS